MARPLHDLRYARAAGRLRNTPHHGATARKALSPANLAGDFAGKAEVARQGVQAFYEAILAGEPPAFEQWRALFGTAFEALGIGMLPEQAFGDEAFETDWMDTSESQRILDFQRYGFDDFRADFKHGLRWQRWALLPLRPLARRSLLHFSGPWQSRRKGATSTGGCLP